ncbi:MAG: hypothetical protein IKS04_00920, partial [Clostridia bacterium]|nr:hypothetical protein [Clostridia bacterium]
VSVETGTDYHISKGNSSLGDENFFNIRKINDDQVFGGSIYCSENAAGLLLNSGIDSLRIGASLSSQYGLCDFELSKSASGTQTASLKAGESIILRLLSDTVFIDKNGNNSLCVEDFVDDICGVGCFGISKDAEGRNMVYSKTCTVSGFNSKWGMPKQQFYAFEKGSVFVLTALKDIDNLPAFAGILNSEGCGQIEWASSSAGEYNILKPAAAGAKQECGETCDKVSKIIEKAKSEKIKEEVVIAALNAAKSCYNPELSASAAMRIMTLYQGKGENITPNEFEEGSKKYFKKNVMLSKLSKGLLNKFNEGKFDSAYFGLFVRTFLGRYKEVHRINNNEKEDTPNE